MASGHPDSLADAYLRTLATDAVGLLDLGINTSNGNTEKANFGADSVVLSSDPRYAPLTMNLGDAPRRCAIMGGRTRARMSRPESSREPLGAPVLYSVFLASGFAAILYQLVWQRSLFRLLGTSSESVTMVVTAFMLGLGLGSMAGGAITRRSRWTLPVVFGAMELGVGVFGLVSLPIFGWLASLATRAQGLAIGLVAFVAVLVPTLLMGGTLPVLVAHLVRRSGNVGRSVGLLYFINTLGSALGSFAAAGWILGAMGQKGSVFLAAAINLAVATAILGTYAVGRRTA